MIHTLSKNNLHNKIDYLDCRYDKYPCNTFHNNENLKDLFLKEYSETEYLEIVKNNKFVKLVGTNREYIIKNNIKYKKNSLIDHLLNFYNTYNGDKWNNYRIGDIIKGYIYCRYINCYNIKKDSSYYNTCNTLNYINCEENVKEDRDYLTNININFPNSIGSKYVNYVDFPNSFKHEDFDIIRLNREIVSTPISTIKSLLFTFLV